MNVNRQDLHLLTEIGYASVMFGIADQAEPIFNALSKVCPENAAGSIGLAISEMSRGNFDAAAEILERSSRDADTSAGEAKAILMLALFLGGRVEEAEQLAEDVREQGGAASSMVETLFG